MSNHVFPTFAGQSIKLTKQSIWKTVIQESVSGRETRTRLYSYPKYVFKLDYEFLTDNGFICSSLASGDKEALVAFYNKVGGAFDDFLFLDPTDNKVENQVVGIGDGLTTQFQLIRTVGDWPEPIFGTVNPITVKIDGNVTISYSIDNFGLITFNVPPTMGKIISWTGNFYYRVRFLQDTLEYTRFLSNLWQCDSLELITVKL